MKLDRAAVVLYESASPCHSSFVRRRPIGQGYVRYSLSFSRTDTCLASRGVQDHRQEAGLGFAARVLALYSAKNIVRPRFPLIVWRTTTFVSAKLRRLENWWSSAALGC